MQPSVFFNEFVPVALGLLGLVVGSFLNVCIYRMPRKCMSLTSPGSRCNSCQTRIAWYDNIPLVSYLFLGGRCRHCGETVSLQYPMIELLNAVLYLTAYLSVRADLSLSPHDFGGMDVSMSFLLTPELIPFWAELSVRMVVLSALVVVSMIDLKYRIIPDVLSVTGIAFALLIGLVFPEHLRFFSPLPTVSGNELSPLNGLLGALLGIIVGGGGIYAIKVFGELVFQKPSMGFGDVKLMAALGGLLGWHSMPLVLLLASVIGSVVGVLIVWIKGDHYIPFGPFLSVGAAILLLAGRYGRTVISHFIPVAFT